jgi:hypothetical protein
VSVLVQEPHTPLVVGAFWDWRQLTTHTRLTVHSNTRRGLKPITLMVSDDEGVVVVGINKHYVCVCVCVCRSDEEWVSMRVCVRNEVSERWCKSRLYVAESRDIVVGSLSKSTRHSGEGCRSIRLHTL